MIKSREGSSEGPRVEISGAINCAEIPGNEKISTWAYAQ
jgi:hypothetical protein